VTYRPVRGAPRRLPRGTPRQRLTGIVNPVKASVPTFWYDARDITSTAQQTLPNRVGSATIQFGATSGAEGTDPVALPAPAGNAYVYLPGTANNNLGIPRGGGWAATTHITATKTDSSTATFTSTADPIPIGNASLAAGSYKSFVLRDNDGAGTVQATIDLTTETVSQTSWTCTTGQTITVNRSSSGTTLLIVTRPVMMCDSTDDFLIHDAGDTPTFTATTGTFTLLAVTRLHYLAGVGNAGLVWSSESGSLNGFRIQQDQANSSYTVAVGGATTSAIVSGATLPGLSQSHTVAGIVNNGNLKAYTNTGGIVGNANTTGVGTITHTTPKAFRIAYTSSGVKSRELFALVAWNRALAATELGTISSYLLGVYA